MPRLTAALDRVQPWSTDAALLTLRVAAFSVFTYHGAQFLFGAFGGHGIQGTAGFFASLGIPLPTLSVIVSGLVMFVGGAILLLGLTETLSRLFAAALTFNMLVAATTAHSGWDVRANGAEFAVTMGLIALALALAGPGRLNVANAARALQASPARPAAVHA